jgi:DNA helicase HerA-like ATPase
MGETTSQERRDGAQPDSRVLGRVIQCDGARATLAAFACDEQDHVLGLWIVGRMISINLGDIRTVGLVYRIETPTPSWNEAGQNPISVHVELVGEVRDGKDGKPLFDKGITAYPHIGAIAHRIRARDLEAVYDLAGRRALTIGQLSQDETIAARIAIDDTLNRHFAVVGTTGVGKSTAVSLLLRKAIEARPDLRVLILDPHNEFSTAFPEQSIRINTQTLDLPFWLFRLEELVEVLYRGREPIPEEIDLLRDLIPAAKQGYRAPTGATVVRRSNEGAGITADTPVPYRMADVLKLIDDRMGLLETKNDRPVYRALRIRIDAAMNDPAYRFMFASRLIDDNIHETIGRIFRVPHEGRPITCLDLSVLPSEVVNSVCSVLARIAFDLAVNSQGRLKLLVLCEEAHRYMPADPRLGFAPTRHALSRIAKEGRKYGCYLGVVTQRPGELDPTVLSQCSTVFAMRLSNEVDQDIIRSAIADSSASTLSFLSSMGQREAIAFGEGVATTMRMKFEYLTAAQLPGSGRRKGGDQPVFDEEVDIHSLVASLRGRTDASFVSSPEFGMPADPLRQAGDPAPLPPEKRAPQPEDRFRRRFGDDDALRRLYE